MGKYFFRGYMAGHDFQLPIQCSKSSFFLTIADHAWEWLSFSFCFVFETDGLHYIRDNLHKLTLPLFSLWHIV